MKKFLGVFTKSNARAASPEDVAKVTVVNKLECVASLSRKTSAGLVTGSRHGDWNLTIEAAAPIAVAIGVLED